MRRSRLKWIVLGVIALAVALPVALVARTLPQTEGELRLAGLGDAVQVIRDGHGIPTIRAETWDDAFFALGFVHAQDRFFQMEMTRRVGAGRLSELVGAAGLGTDRYMRKLGIYKLAQAQAATASPALKRRLDAYGAGINAWIAETGWPRAVEFIPLLHAPEPWLPTDSLIWGKLMALRLANNWRTEYLRLGLAQRLTPTQIDFLWPPYPEDAPIALPKRAGVSFDDLAPLPSMAWDPRADGAPSTASNAWALAGSRTASGKPLLASDPHLEFRAPILWYLARLETPDGVLAGATVPGVPFLVIGHNGRVAWGFTTTGADTEDLIVETPAAGHHTYRTADGTTEFRVRSEIIEVRDGEAETVEILTTPDGPVLTDAPTTGVQHPLTLTAPYLDPDDRTPEALMKLNAATSAAEVQAALADFHAPVQNLLFATKDGHIGQITAGRIPLRRRGDGRLPLVRAHGPVGSAGYLSYDAMPRYLDPTGGAVMNANNKVTPPGTAPDLTRDWPSPFRAERLADLLSTEKPNSQAAQMDIRSGAARMLVPAALGLLDDAGRSHPLAQMLDRWDGAMDRTHREPLVYMIWARHLKRAVFADDLGAQYRDWHGLRTQALAGALTTAAGADWCDDQETPDIRETCARMVARALDATAEDLAQRDTDAGRSVLWGDVHIARFEHPVFSHIPLLADWTAVEVATDGGNTTLNRGAMWLGRDNAAFQHRHGAGLRAIMDMGDPGANRFIIATGQSGNPLSSHYRDLVETWRDGGGLTLAPPRNGSGDVLKILPRR